MHPSWLAVVHAALAEDLDETGDVTSEAVIPADASIECDVVFRTDSVVCGLEVVEATLAAIDPAVRCDWALADSDRVRGGESAGRVRGPARSVLAGERTALNLLSHLSGVGTRTAQFVRAVEGTKALIYDTRKTTPGLRALEKYAVLCGGGRNHRMGLYDQVLIKDNHLALGGGVAETVRAARKRWGSRYTVEVEVESSEDAVEACEAGADIVLLDNMSTAQLRAAVQAIGGRCTLEASGGVSLVTVRAVAETGVDRIAVGALTNGPGVDVAFDEVG